MEKRIFACRILNYDGIQLRLGKPRRNLRNYEASDDRPIMAACSLKRLKTAIKAVVTVATVERTHPEKPEEHLLHKAVTARLTNACASAKRTCEIGHNAHST